MLTRLQEEIVEFYHENPFVNFLRLQVIPLDDGTVKLELPIDFDHTNLYGIAHGGVLTTMADTAMGAACLMKNKKVVTLSLTIDFMHAVAVDDKVIATAKVLHDGARTMACESELVSESGKLFAKANATFYVLEKFIDE